MQQRDRIAILYNQGQVHHARLNLSHPARVVPSSKGDSIALYEAMRL